MNTVNEIKNTLIKLGKKLGYIPFDEVELLPGEKIDVVWLDKTYKEIYGEQKIALWKSLSPVVVAFEIELHPSNTKALRGSIDTLQRTGANLNVLIISETKIKEENRKWKENAEEEIKKGKRKKKPVAPKWGSYEKAYQNLQAYAQRASARIIVLPIENIEKLKA